MPRLIYFFPPMIYLHSGLLPLQSDCKSKVNVYGLDVRVAITCMRQHSTSTGEKKKNAHFSSAYSPNSRPIPDCWYPPNGTLGLKVLMQFTHRVPALSLCAVSMARLMFCENTAAARPYTVSLAWWTTSAKPFVV